MVSKHFRLWVDVTLHGSTTKSCLVCLLRQDNQLLRPRAALAAEAEQVQGPEWSRVACGEGAGTAKPLPKELHMLQADPRGHSGEHGFVIHFISSTP